MKRQLLALGMAIVCVSWISCATKTELSGVWKSDSAAARPMSGILVIGIAENDLKRRSFEDGFAAALKEQGVDAVSSYQVLPNPDRLSKKSIQRAIRGPRIPGSDRPPS